MSKLNGEFQQSNTLEGKLASELEFIEISIKTIQLGIDGTSIPRADRIATIAAVAKRALEIQIKIEKRDARKARVAA